MLDMVVIRGAHVVTDEKGNEVVAMSGRDERL